MKRYIKSVVHLVTEDSYDDQYAWATSNEIDSRTLALLADHKDDLIRCVVAGNPNTSIDTLRKLSTDEVQGVRVDVARNINTPVDILYNLVNDPSVYVRIGLIMNSNCPNDIFRTLSRDTNESVRYEILHRPNCTLKLSREDVLRLCNDPDWTVARLAVKRAKECGYLES